MFLSNQVYNLNTLNDENIILISFNFFTFLILLIYLFPTEYFHVVIRFFSLVLPILVGECLKSVQTSALLNRCIKFECFRVEGKG